MSRWPLFHTSRLQLQILDEAEAGRVADYYRRNRAFHQPWFPSRGDEIFTAAVQRQNLGRELNDFEQGRSLPFWLSLAEDPNRIIGRFIVGSIVHGAFHSGVVSYHLDEQAVGRGLAEEAGTAVIRLAFQDFGLHRVQASILPHNDRSIALAERLGFELEGMSSRYLMINDRWEDHLHYVRLSDGPLHRTADLPLLYGERIRLRPLALADIPQIVAYYERNLTYLAAYNPVDESSVLKPGFWQQQISQSLQQLRQGNRLDLGIFLSDRPDHLVGLIDAHDLHGLPLASGEISYSVDQVLSGQGLVLESLSVALTYLFTECRLRRITARIHPENQRSRKLLEILGFAAEGIERSAVQTRTGWQDLVRYGVLADEFRPF